MMKASRDFDAYFQQAARKAHAYPPPEMYRPLSFSEVRDAWDGFAREDAGHPFGLYVHLPFCERKCSFCYCDTVITKDQDRVDAYLSALSLEAELFSQTLGSTPCRTVYLGGGTPTWIGPERLDALLSHLRRCFQWTEDVHLNIESTPGCITEEMAAVLGAHHTTRVTLGVQALDEKILNSMNRPQTMDGVAQAMSRLRSAGVSVINLDLVGGLPGDTVQSFERGFDELLSFGPDMVHVYPYSERGTHTPNEHKRQIVRRSEQMMYDRGFRAQKHDAWGLGPHTRNLQVIDKIEHGGSCLGLGVRSRSHIFNRLAYRSVFNKAYVTPLLEGKEPEYHGWPMTKKLQIQRYLMDNLQGGLDREVFQRHFSMDPVQYLKRRHPDLALHLKEQDDGLRVTGPYESGHDHAVELFDDRLKGALYSAWSKMPNGWPDAARTTPLTDDDAKFDVNWMHFLAIHLSKGNTYPPIAYKEPITDSQVRAGWASLGKKIRAGKASAAVGLYCHIPYCATLCKFCYCYKHLLERPQIIESYVDAVISQAQHLAPSLRGIRLNSMYFGGGTPSILTEEQMRRLIGTLREQYDFTDDHQFNFEGTPATLTRGQRLETLAELGVTRLTVGIQSLERELLNDMNRAQQGASKVKEVIDRARAAGIRHINTDLMVGLPQQTYENFQCTLDTLVSWKPDVIHVYPFQPTPETRYFQEGFRVTSAVETLREQMMACSRKVLASSGYQQIPNESWALSADARNRQDAEKIESAASILPLGYLARGHIFGEMSYGSLEPEYKAYVDDHSKRDVYAGALLTVEDDMVRYLISNLTSGVDRSAFFRIFGEDPLTRFWQAFRWLHRNQKVRVTRTHIESLMSSSAETVVFAKALFHSHYNEQLREIHRATWDPSVDWAARWREMYAESF